MNIKLKTVAKVSSIFVQDAKRAVSMIGSGTFDAVCAVVATTAGFEGAGWLLICSADDKNSGGCNNLRDISRGSRPQMPWSAELFNVETCLHCFALVDAAISLNRFAIYAGCFLVDAIQSRTN